MQHREWRLQRMGEIAERVSVAALLAALIDDHRVEPIGEALELVWVSALDALRRAALDLREFPHEAPQWSQAPAHHRALNQQQSRRRTTEPQQQRAAVGSHLGLVGPALLGEHQRVGAALAILSQIAEPEQQHEAALQTLETPASDRLRGGSGNAVREARAAPEQRRALTEERSLQAGLWARESCIRQLVVGERKFAVLIGFRAAEQRVDQCLHPLELRLRCARLEGAVETQPPENQEDCQRQ